MVKRVKRAKRARGTKEWAAQNVNCILGCSHKCRYCYARGMAERFRRIPEGEIWGESYLHVRTAEVKKRRRKASGTVMFPSSHDITPETLEPCLTVLKNLLESGKSVLIVSKPHLQCIKEICSRFSAYKGQIAFRFSIGATDNGLLRYWEPGAPPFDERLECLKYAYQAGFSTSVSAEPLLDVANAEHLYEALSPFITDTIWFGKMNRVRNCVKIETSEDERQVKAIEDGQSDECIWALYEAFKDRPLVEWKDSIKDVIDATVLNMARS